MAWESCIDKLVSRRNRLTANRGCMHVGHSGRRINFLNNPKLLVFNANVFASYIMDIPDDLSNSVNKNTCLHGSDIRGGMSGVHEPSD